MPKPGQTSDTQNDAPETGDDVAVALAYLPGNDDAPRVVAKGKGGIAQSIIEIARANGVAIERNADLATLLQAVDLDKEIPPEAFAAVAEILGYLYQVNGRADELKGDRGNGDTQ